MTKRYLNTRENNEGMEEKYKEVHIWEFPPTEIFIRLNDEFRKRIFSIIKDNFVIKDFVFLINQRAEKYGIERNYNTSNFRSWRVGLKKTKEKTIEVNIPLWVLIEISKLLSDSSSPDNKLMKKAEKEIEYYAASGNSLRVNDPNLPVLFTPEMVSVLFHFCGDGHIGTGTDQSHYRQTNTVNLKNFEKKLRKCFGDFEVRIYENSKLLIPRPITQFYIHHFYEGELSSSIGIPEHIKTLPKKFLVAGLAAFIVDDGHMSDALEIYSKNCELAKDIFQIARKLGYKTSINKKYRYGKFDTYRLIISLESLPQFYKDIKSLSKEFPTCDLASKMAYLEQFIRRKNRKWDRRPPGKTKELIIKFLEKDLNTANELATKLNIRPASLREHLLHLEEENLIKRVGKDGRKVIWEKA